MCEGASRRDPNPPFTNHTLNSKFCIQRLAFKSIVTCVAEHCGKIQKCSHESEVIAFFSECHQEGRKEGIKHPWKHMVFSGLFPPCPLWRLSPRQSPSSII